MDKLLTKLNVLALAVLAFVGANPTLPAQVLALFPGWAQAPVVVGFVALWGALVRYAQLRERRAAAITAVRAVTNDAA